MGLNVLSSNYDRPVNYIPNDHVSESFYPAKIQYWLDAQCSHPNVEARALCHLYTFLNSRKPILLNILY